MVRVQTPITIFVLTIDRGSQRGAVHLLTWIHNDDRCNGLLYIFGFSLSDVLINWKLKN